MTLPDREQQGVANGPRLYYADANDQPAVDVITDGLRLLTDGQGGDRASLRTIRYLTDPNGAPLLDGRGELRREIEAGTFTDLRRAAELAAESNARGAHVYVHVQRTGAPVTNRLQPGNIGTVRTDGVAAYVALFVDIDAEPGAEPGAAVAVASELEEVLVDTVRVPRGAIMLEQSGRGAYLLVAIEPQPLSARPTMQLALRTIGRMIAAAGEGAHCDEGVFDAPRIKRVPGTRNWKSDADPATPAWTLKPWTPGVRAPWSIVEKIASKSRPKVRAVPAAAKPQNLQPGDRRPLRHLFVDRGWLHRERPDGVCDVRCPNADQHTDGRDGAILYPPTNAGGPGWLKCSHSHRAGLTLFDVFRLLRAR